MATGIIKSAFSTHYINNDWEQQDWDNYEFRINLMTSMGFKVIKEKRNFNADEKKFMAELEAQNDLLRKKYGVAA